ncbi:sigma-54-dependent Fis family transcriptional regulator [Persicimonas caeni]|uniref:Sigma-54-dependent Fis family transcriptional regulator n=1 Tax=Persicimonas caeni TaxID=2292766 RepID=A0A4Y6PNX6_PERCE|nr:sigma-54 dependent transcriptional regulator [Persicimonas caeni]QDG50004.1 sigma-54-dependent Fis family transcriptional regulator [Persicimonas caeni]QED31225.1 sigma-54-dependent Fis family transcriptional regulator [Persicimonas caeni]
MDKLRILVIDDEESIRHMLTVLLEKEGYAVKTVGDGEEGLKELLTREYDLVLTDVRMPKMDGLELIDEVLERNIPTTVIAMSAFGNREMAIDALKRGAYDYFDKPFKKDEVLLTLAKAEERLQLKRENDALKGFSADGEFQNIVGDSEPMQAVYGTVSKVAGYKSTILLTGESGTGKELIARAIHNLSPRKDEAWVPINCGAIPENLLESELFGHVRGAFTDATQDKVGLFEEAHKGTLFLDEIAELPMNLQVKLLRVLQENEIRRVGGNKSIPVDVRIVAASLHDLGERVEEGLFREDLYYRLNVINIQLPPLRERREDVRPLVDFFIAKQNQRLGTSITGVEPEAMKLMLDYHWPGNVRELQNCIERGVVLANGHKIDESVLPDRILDSNDELKQLFNSDELSIKKMSTALERILIRRALEKTGGNRTNAAKLLEISHRALLYKIKDYGLETVGMET